ncbi:acylphosphatase-1-like [Asterias amurensis]|uniref:acylphosphatase-1-like n=1 Tax=Asterias amurensis TaxID=7602 RepID=UPI003AB23555
MAANVVKAASSALVSVEFEVFGIVQGVFFRKYTKKKAIEHGLVGWVKNTKTNTVVGQAQGSKDKISLLKTWLRTKGSPRSVVKRAVFKNEKPIDQLVYTQFDII